MQERGRRTLAGNAGRRNGDPCLEQEPGPRICIGVLRGIEQMPFQIFETEARSILSPVSGYLAEAGFTHSLSPARNCTFGCSYCYVPTMRVQAGLRPDDWKHWGARTTFKTNAGELLGRALRPHQVIYCSPLTDPYQPSESDMRLMPAVLEAVANHPPHVFVIQTPRFPDSPRYRLAAGGT